VCKLFDSYSQPIQCGPVREPTFVVPRTGSAVVTGRSLQGWPAPSRFSASEVGRAPAGVHCWAPIDIPTGAGLRSAPSRGFNKVRTRRMRPGLHRPYHPKLGRLSSDWLRFR
jgi:hypothetical protein